MQLELKHIGTSWSKFKLNDVDTSLEPVGVRVKAHIYTFRSGFTMFFLIKIQLDKI